MAATETSLHANAALDGLYRRHVGDVYRYTYAVLGNHADAEDVTQTTFVNALRALERGETPEDPSRWLVVIAHNVVRQRWRQAASRPDLVELESDLPDGVADDEEGSIELEELVRALQRIPPTQREALVMRELEGRPYREIAEVLGLSTSALETLLFRARRSLAEEIENVVTCQNAELAISQRLDGRLSRKDRKRLEEHLAECAACARLAETTARQRRAFKGLALLPLPVGLALFKGTPTAAAASLPTIGLATAGSGASGTAAAGAGGGAATVGGAAAGGSLAGALGVKVAAVAVAAVVATGVAYKGVQAVRDTPAKPAPAESKATRDGGANAQPRLPAVSAGEGAEKARGAARAKAAKHAKSAAATKPNRAKHGGSPPGLAHKPATPASGRASAPTGNVSNGKAVGRDHAKPEKPRKASPGAPTDTVEAPKKPKRSPKLAAPPTSTEPKPAVPPTTPGSSEPSAGPQTETPPAAPQTPPPSSASQLDASGTPSPTPGTALVPAPSGETVAPESPASPPATPPAETPPAETPSTDPGSSPGATPPGSTDGSSNEGSEHGKRLGHHKSNHDGRHTEDS